MLRITRFLFFTITCASGQAAVINIYNSLAGFTAALGVSPTQTQDFSAFAANASLVGVNFLPGVTATTANTGGLVVFGADKTMFSLTGGGSRANPAYTLNIASPYNAIGFLITAWNPAAPGTLDVILNFADATQQTINLSRPLGATEGTPQFFGVVSNTNLTSLRVNEPFEVGGTLCCEEVSLDNFVAASTPEPATYALTGLGLVAAVVLQRRFWKR